MALVIDNIHSHVGHTPAVHRCTTGFAHTPSWCNVVIFHICNIHVMAVVIQHASQVCLLYSDPVYHY